jgi:hypothetical protein
MTKTLKLFIITILFQLTGCGYPGISGKVVDGVSGMPLEGAVVLAQWTKTHGMPGLTSHSVYKIEETETDKEGMFSLSGAYSPFLDPPEMVIYKKGYVPWRNDMDFMNPTWKHYEENIWQNNMTYKLNIFADKYTYGRLYSFLDYSIMGRGGTETPIFSELMRKISILEQAEIEKQMRKDNKP